MARIKADADERISAIDRRTLLASGAALIVTRTTPVIATAGTPWRKPGEWPAYAATNAATKYSPLDQIDASNVGTLEIAWEWLSPDAAIIAANPELKPGEFQATPIMADGMLFVSTAMSQVAAIDPASGKTLWVHDPGSWRKGYPTSKGFQHRGVAYWCAGKDRRVLIATGDNRLIALDAATGKPVADFGANGEVELATAGLQRSVAGAPSSLMGVTSPPLICRDVVVVGQYIDDRPSQSPMPVGDVRGYDVRSGKLLWSFHTIPLPGEYGAESWKDESAAANGNANVWAPMSADDALGLVYLPTSCPTNNFYGGDRPGDNLFGNSLVALDVKTGKRRWHFQIVHHDLWDYDLPCAPNLIDVTMGGVRVPAVAQVTKHGFCFVFDRRTGRPLWPIEERPVPQSEIESERTSLTQPFPTRPPPFERQGVSDNDLVDFTPELKEAARKILAGYDHGGLFMPLGTRPTTVLPSWVGGANWGGAAADPETGMLYVPSLTAIVSMALDPTGRRTDTGDGAAEIAGQASVVRGPGGMPLIKPPYGRITAIDLNRGEIGWTRPNGPGPMDMPAFAAHNTGWLGNTGRTGPLLTKTLLFMGEGPHSQFAKKLLRAYDKTTGAVRGEVALPDHTLGPPMSYLAGGRQFIVCGMGFRSTPHRLVALALPKTGEK